MDRSWRLPRGGLEKQSDRPIDVVAMASDRAELVQEGLVESQLLWSYFGNELE